VAVRAYLGDERRHGELEQLLLRSGEGDVDAFAELYDQLAPRVFGLVTNLVEDAAASEAITCEAFVEAWRRSSTYDPDRCSAAAWTLVLAHQLAMGARRLSALRDE
jgi:RNA polymerase sigma-70 factor (ECF subfamily)